MGFKIQMTGFKEIDELLKRLPEEVSQKVQVAAYTEAAKLVRDDAQLKAPLDEGDLVESITIAVEKRGRNTGTVYVGPDKTKGGWKAHFIEFGTTGHTINLGGVKTRGKKKGQAGKQVLAKKMEGGEYQTFGTETHHPGTAPQPFMRPAWENNKERVRDTIKLLLGKRLQSLIKRTVKKNKQQPK